MQFTFDTLIDAPREQVFAFLADPENRPRWQPSIRSFDMEPQGELRVGIHWRESVPVAGTFEMEISEYEPPVRWAERLRSKRFSGTVAMTFAEEAGGTRVTLEADVQLKGILWLGTPFAKIVLRREMRKDLGRIAALLRA